MYYLHHCGEHRGDGNYHPALMHTLGRAGFDTKLGSSVALARTREALHNSWAFFIAMRIAPP